MRLAAGLLWIAGWALAQMSLDQALADAAKWKTGDSRAALRTIVEAVQKARTAPEKQAIEKRLVALVESDATLDAKAFVCEQIGLIGSDAAIPVLGPLLTDQRASDMARLAIERIPGSASDAALREALAKTSGRVRIGILSSIGARRDAGAVAALKPLASDSDAATATAAQHALANIADAAAVQALSETKGASEALLNAADNLTERGNRTAAAAIYRKLVGTGEAPLVRAGALHGLVVVEPGAAEVGQALRGNDPRMQAIAIRALAERSPDDLEAVFAKLPEVGRVRVLEVLGEARRSSPLMKPALADASAAVRVAALDALGAVGDPTAASTVAALAAKEGAERDAARACLALMPGKEVDARIVSELASAEPKVRLELIRAAGARGSAGASPLLLKLASDPDAEVRRESVRALRDTATAGEVSGLAALLIAPPSAGDRAEIGRSLAAAVRRGGPERSEAVLKAYHSTKDPAARAALLGTLGPAGHAPALPALRSALKPGEDADVVRAAILALTEWPDAAPVNDLLDVARNGSTAAQQVLALRGAIKLIGLPAASRSPQESVKMLSEAATLAKQPEEKKALLALAPRYQVQESLDLARKFADDPQVATEARAAVARLERSVRR